MSNNETPPAPTVWPAFQARDPRALIAFLTSAFGFREAAAYDDGSGGVAHAQLDWPEGGGVMFGSHKPGGRWSREPGTAGFYVVAEHVEEVYERAREAGAEIVQPLAETSYGGPEFTCADPEGNLWSFGSYRGEPPAA